MNAQDFSIVLLGRFPGKDRNVAQALAKIFGKDDTWGLQVVGATPITILGGMSEQQANLVYVEFSNIEDEAGCRFRVDQGEDESFPALNWPAPPYVNGRRVDEFQLGGAPTAPVSASSGTACSCPHCGKPIQVSLLAGSGAPSAPASAPSKIIAPPVPTGPVPIPIPKPKTPPIAAPLTPRRIQPPAAAAMVTDDFADEDLVPLGEIAAPAARNRQSKRKKRNKKGASPLPEVPVVESPDPKPALVTDTSPIKPLDPRLSGPMALEDFEKGLVMGPSKETPERKPGSPVKPGRAKKRKKAKPASSADNDEQDDPDQLCSIFIGRNASPKIHELVAEIQGITVQEAQKLCQKSVVPIVKDIPVGESHPIKRRFRELQVNPRIMLLR